jgi:hypothetical protein
MGLRIDLTGDRFGLLTVREFVGMNSRRQSLYICECACKRLVTARGTELTSNAKRKCSQACTYEPPKMQFTFIEVTRGERDRSHFGK